MIQKTLVLRDLNTETASTETAEKLPVELLLETTELWRMEESRYMHCNWYYFTPRILVSQAFGGLILLTFLKLSKMRYTEIDVSYKTAFSDMV